jgi:hypothetical protein
LYDSDETFFKGKCNLAALESAVLKECQRALRTHLLNGRGESIRMLEMLIESSVANIEGIQLVKRDFGQQRQF